jgi:hypothetical protein
MDYHCSIVTIKLQGHSGVNGTQTRSLFDIDVGTEVQRQTMKSTEKNASYCSSPSIAPLHGYDDCCKIIIAE